MSSFVLSITFHLRASTYFGGLPVLSSKWNAGTPKASLEALSR